MVKVVLLATLFGPYKIPGEDAVRGAELALKEFNYSAGGLDIELITKGTDATPDSVIFLLEESIKEGVELFVGPLSGNEALAVRQVARKNPKLTFVNGASGSQPAFSPADNFFMFNPTGSQVMSGLGEYCYNQLGYKRIVTVGEAYSFPYAQIGGFAYDFVKSGGAIEEYHWCALGNDDYEDIINKIPQDIDAVYSSLGGTDGIHFIDQFRSTRADTPLIAGTIFGDQSLLMSVGEHSNLLTGVVSASTHSDDLATPEAVKFRSAYQQEYGESGFYAPSYFALTYYTNMKALLIAIGETKGDLSKIQDKLAQLEFETPAGKVHLNHYRVAVIDTFINKIQQTDEGALYTHMIKRIDQTTNTLGMDDETYMEKGKFDRFSMP